MYVRSATRGAVWRCIGAGDERAGTEGDRVLLVRGSAAQPADAWRTYTCLGLPRHPRCQRSRDRRWRDRHERLFVMRAVWALSSVSAVTFVSACPSAGGRRTSIVGSGTRILHLTDPWARSLSPMSARYRELWPVLRAGSDRHVLPVDGGRAPLKPGQVLPGRGHGKDARRTPESLCAQRTPALARRAAAPEVSMSALGSTCPATLPWRTPSHAAWNNGDAGGGGGCFGGTQAAKTTAAGTTAAHHRRRRCALPAGCIDLDASRFAAAPVAADPPNRTSRQNAGCGRDLTRPIGTSGADP